MTAVTVLAGMSLDPKAQLELALWMAPGVLGDRELFKMQSEPWQLAWIANAERAMRAADLIPREEAVRVVRHHVQSYNICAWIEDDFRALGKDPP